MRKKNVYMGNNSIAQLHVFGNVDTDNEICLNAIATAYDALNDIILTRSQGIFQNATATEINARFGELHLLCSRYSPRMHHVVDKLHKVVIENSKGRISDANALGVMRDICKRHGINSDIFDYAILRINQAEQFKKQTRSRKIPDRVESNALFFWNVPTKKKKRR